jgi:CubicO group peptidase (beta-lactamase class C family)
MKNFISMIICFISATLISAQSMQISAIDSILTEMTKKDLFSGAVLIAEGSNVLLSKGYGYSDKENKVLNTPDTRFDLSSGSKIFTGTAITYLAQLGKINFTDKIGKYIPDLPSGNRITIHQALTHTAGLANFYLAENFSYEKVKNCTDIMPFMKKLPLVYNPGDTCIYSTGNTIVLGAIVEKVTGMNFQDYITNTFLQPLKMDNTSFTSYSSLNESQRQYAIGYYKDSTQHYIRNKYDYDSGFVPLSAGGAWSSVNDLFKFDNAVFTNKIVNEEYLKIMTTPYSSGFPQTHFGYIWLTDESGTYCIGHAGNSSGWNTWNYYYPKQKYTIIILTNFGFVDVFELATRFDKILFQ